MKHSKALEFFYLTVQFVMLLVSVPKVALLLHNYDAMPSFGPTPLGVGLISWFGGVAIDATAALTSWAALQKYAASRQRADLLPPSIIIGVCTLFSFIANYESAAVMHPLQYEHITLIRFSASLVNPLVVAMPPLIVLLLIAIVPSVMSTPRIKTAEEWQAEAAAEEAKQQAEARKKIARAQANAAIRSEQVKGMITTAAAAKDSAAVNLFGRQQAVEQSADCSTGDHGDDDPNGGGGLPHDRVANGHDATHSAAQSFPGLVRMGKAPVSQPNRAAYNRMPLHRRAAESGVLTARDLVEALGISDSQARSYLLDIPTTVRMGEHKTAMIETPVNDVLAYFQSKGSHAGNAHYRRLSEALAPRRGGKSHHAASTVTSAAVSTGGRAALSVVHPQPAAQMGAQSGTKQSQRYSAGEYDAGYAGGYAVEPRVAVEAGGQ